MINTIANNEILERNLRALRNPKDLSKEKILVLVKETLKELGYSGEDIALFSDSIANSVFDTQNISKINSFL